MNTVSVLWTNRDGDPLLAMRPWVHAFVEDSNVTHPWPAAVRAAIILRKQRRRWIRIERLCSRLNVSKTALTHRFRQLYGMSLAEYHRRAKMAWGGWRARRR